MNWSDGTKSAMLDGKWRIVTSKSYHLCLLFFPLRRLPSSIANFLALKGV